MADNERLRIDARANRDRILDVARDSLAADPHASMNSIAKEAGVGAGTLYRHFPSREALLLDVYRKEIDELVALAPVLLNQHAPLAAFRRWCERLTRLGRVKHGIADSLQAAISDKEFQNTYRAMLGAVQQLMSACETVAEINVGVNAADVLVLLSSLLRIEPTSDGEAQTRRVLTLIFRGLGASPS